MTQVSVIEVFGVTTRGRSSSMTEPAGNVLLIIIMISMRRGILVKLVICVSSGQLKIKIANLMQYATLAYFLPFGNTWSLENMVGNLIAPLTKLLYHIIGNSMSRGDIQNIMQWGWQDKSIYLTQMNCQRLHIDGKKYSRNQSCFFFRICDMYFLFILTQ